MPSEHIDRTSLAPDAERHLNRTLPAKGPQASHQRVDQLSMGLVEQPIERFAVPSNSEIEVGAKRAYGIEEVSDHRPCERSCLDLLDGRARDPRSHRDIDLPLPGTNSKGAECATQTNGIHTGSIASSAYARVVVSGDVVALASSSI